MNYHLIIYDLVTKQVLAWRATGSKFPFELKPQNARMLAVVPASAGTVATYSSRKLTTGAGVVIDYFHIPSPE